MNNTSYITLSKSAVVKNVNFIRSILQPGTKLSLVVKSNAYGHGIEQYVPLLEKCGVDHFSVFNYDEAVRVLSVTNKSTVMVMGWIADKDILEAVLNKVEMYIFNIDRLTLILEKARKLKKKALLHLEVETGMNRTGLDKNEFKKAIRILNENTGHFILKGFCTHLAGPESISNYVRIKKQLKKFATLQDQLSKNNLKPEYLHTANSAASIVYPKAQMDMVRVGILQYGFWPSKETFIHYVSKVKNNEDPLKRVISWYSQIMTIKHIKRGEFIGYGNYYLANQDMQIALIPIGYSNGYRRSLSNRGRVLINGHRCAVIGIINMNMIIADITNLENINTGDEVVIIGNQNGVEMSVSSFSDISDQLNYEVLSRLPLDIPRIVVE